MCATNAVGDGPDVLVIEAAHGRGELVVGGAVGPDTYMVNKTLPAILVGVPVAAGTLPVLMKIAP